MSATHGIPVESDLAKSVTRPIYYFISIVAVAAGFYYIYTYDGLSNLSQAFPGNFNDRIEIPVPFTHYLLPILPPSAFALGISLFFYERKFGWRALPLIFMVSGAFDFLWNRDAITFIFQGDFWVFFQLAIMIGGWLAAGRPKFLSTKYLFICLFLFAVTNFTYNQPFEFGLLLYVYTSTSWPSKRDTVLIREASEYIPSRSPPT